MYFEHVKMLIFICSILHIVLTYVWSHKVAMGTLFTNCHLWLWNKKHNKYCVSETFKQEFIYKLYFAFFLQ